MRYRRWALTEEHEPSRVTLVHSHASSPDWKSAGSLFVLSFSLFITCTSIFIMYPLFLRRYSFFYSDIHNCSAGMKQAAINMPTLYTEPILIHMWVYIPRGAGVRQILSNIFLICCSLVCAGWFWWQMSCFTHAWPKTSLLYCFDLWSIRQKTAVCDRQRERGELAGWSPSSQKSL